MTATPPKIGRGAGKSVLPAALCRRAMAVLHVGLVFLEEEQVTWANDAAVHLLGDDDEDPEPWRATLALARELGSRTSRGAGRMHSLGTVRGATGRVRLCGARLPQVRGASRCVLLIVVEPTRSSPHATALGPREQRHIEAHSCRRFRLTAQECLVARLLADGLSNARVAVALGISPNTARIHTERVLRKLGVHSRAAVAVALRGGA